MSYVWFWTAFVFHYSSLLEGFQCNILGNSRGFSPWEAINRLIQDWFLDFRNLLFLPSRVEILDLRTSKFLQSMEHLQKKYFTISFEIGTYFTQPAFIKGQILTKWGIVRRNLLHKFSYKVGNCYFSSFSSQGLLLEVRGGCSSKPHNVFPRTVSEETILFWIWKL